MNSAQNWRNDISVKDSNIPGEADALFKMSLLGTTNKL